MVVKTSNSTGYWFRGREIEWDEELEPEGHVTLWCNARAVT